MTLVQWIVALVALQRVAELVHARRNAAWLIAQGGVEAGAGHYPIMVLLHAAWLAALFFFVPADAPIIWWLLALFVLLQAGRVWVLITLGRFWTTRIITLPDAPLISGGPYRFCRHPNYAIVAAEIAILPLAFGAWEIALLFSLLNGLLLLYRIRMEDAVLSPRRAEGGRRGHPG
ncbi:isoprenylcysteine carboxylmethyltransferase family protein [Rhodospirillaceae bacterium SYSU D60014]|uniref:isoprenylcysteine carboxyl methyltransferase family protein n=1 Tax=Virgifigura deserti TaxID=2268457 RepID=UPI000E671A9B